MNRMSFLLTAASALLMLGASAQTLTEGEVRKVDKAGGRVTLKHGAVKTLDLPPMTLAYRAQPPSLLDKLKAGDKVRFAAEKRDGIYTVTRIEVVN